MEERVESLADAFLGVFMTDGRQVVGCERGQGGRRLRWDGWPVTTHCRGGGRHSSDGGLKRG
eukprot:scaffold4653_cov53-Cyclotella_meneghiniana.AAC.3